MCGPCRTRKKQKAAGIPRGSERTGRESGNKHGHDHDWVTIANQRDETGDEN